MIYWKLRKPVRKSNFSQFAFLLALVSLPISPAFGQSGPPDQEPAINRDVDVNFFSDARIRYQSISQNNIDDTAEALTFRVKAGLEFEFADWLSALVEVEGGESFIDDFDDSVNGRFDVPIIPDRSQLELNRLQVQSEIEGFRVTVGRQDLALDNWRFLGNWQFRQNDQTFDAARLETNLLGGRLNLGYIDKVHRHFGSDSPVGEFSGESYIVNYSRPLLTGRLSLFHYALDLETGPDAAPIDTFSTVTSGARWHGRRHWGESGVAWDLSAARQSDFANNPDSFEAYYADLSLGFEHKNLELDLGLEVFGSDDGISVQTPLGTLHDFQGVTDRFFTIPPDGLLDYHLDIDVDLGDWGPLERVTLNTGFHQFTSERSRRDYGCEFNLGLSGRIKDVTLLFEYGDYNTQALEADSGLFASDAKALILSANYSFD